MILEHALLNIRPGESPAFERAMQEALPLIGAVLVLVVLMIFVPDIVLLLPRLAFR